VDLLSFMPFYLDFVTPADDIPATQFIRFLRCVRMLRVEGRLLDAFDTFDDIFASKSPLFLSTGFVGLSVWFICSSLYYITERDNPEMVYCPTDDMTDCYNRFESIPSAMYFCLINLFGEFPLIEEHSTGGKMVATFVAIVAVAVFAIPTGIVGGGLEEVMDRRKQEEEEAEAKRLAGGGLELAVVRGVVPRPEKFDFGLQARLQRVVVSNELLVILTGVAMFGSAVSFYLSTSVPFEANATAVHVFNLFEVFCIFLFGAEYCVRLFAAGCDNRYAGFWGRILYAMTMYSILDLMAFLPSLAGIYVTGTLNATIHWRSLRLLRLLKAERKLKSFAAFYNVVVNNCQIFLILVFAMMLMWVFCSTLMYYTERANPDWDVAKYYQSIPGSMWVTLLNLTGESPLCDYTVCGKIVTSVMGLFAVGVFAIPTGLFGAAWEDAVAACDEGSCDGDEDETGVDATGEEKKSWNSENTDKVMIIPFEVSIPVNGKDGETLTPRSLAVSLMTVNAPDGAGKFLTCLEEEFEREGCPIKDCKLLEVGIDAKGHRVVGKKWKEKERKNVARQRRAAGGAGRSLSPPPGVTHAVVTGTVYVTGLTQMHFDFNKNSHKKAYTTAVAQMAGVAEKFVFISFAPVTFEEDVLQLNYTVAPTPGSWGRLNQSVLKPQGKTGDFQSTLVAGFTHKRRGEQMSLLAPEIQSVVTVTSADEPMRPVSGSVFVAGMKKAVNYYRRHSKLTHESTAQAIAAVAQGKVKPDKEVVTVGLCARQERLSSGTSQSSGSSLRNSMHRFLGGETPAGRLFESVILVLIFATCAAAILSTVPSINEEYNYVFDIIEVIAIVIFTFEYAGRVFVAPEGEMHQDKASQLSDCQARSQWVISFYAIVDMLAVLPWYLALFIPFVDKYDEKLRMMRILRLLKLDGAVPSLQLLQDVVDSKRYSLFIAIVDTVILWTFFATWLYLAEIDDFTHGPDGDDPTMAYRYRNAPNSLEYTMIHLTGDFPLVDYTFAGRLTCFFIVFAAVGVTSVPQGIIAAGFTDMLAERRRETRKSRQEASLQIQRMLRGYIHKRRFKQMVAKLRVMKMIDTAMELHSVRALRFALEQAEAVGNRATQKEVTLTKKVEEAKTELKLLEAGGPAARSRRMSDNELPEASDHDLQQWHEEYGEDLEALLKSSGNHDHTFYAQQKTGRYVLKIVEAFRFPVLILIMLNLVMVLVETVPSVKHSVNPAYFDNFELVSVIIFTLEYLARAYSAPYTAKFVYNRWNFLTSFYGIVDLLSIAPWYLMMLLKADDIHFDAAIFRVFRTFRILELENFISAFTMLDDVYHKSKEVLKAAGILALIIWIGGATLFYINEPELFESVPNSMYYTAVFLGGEWGVVDYNVPNKILTIIFCVVAIALFSIPVATLFEAFGDTLKDVADGFEISVLLRIGDSAEMQTFELEELQTHHTVQKIKERIEAVSCISAADMDLMFKGKQLHNKQNARRLCISQGAIIRLQISSDCWDECKRQDGFGGFTAKLCDYNPKCGVKLAED